jgi:hypothetical protein
MNSKKGIRKMEDGNKKVKEMKIFKKLIEIGISE